MSAARQAMLDRINRRRSRHARTPASASTSVASTPSNSPPDPGPVRSQINFTPSTSSTNNISYDSGSGSKRGQRRRRAKSKQRKVSPQQKSSRSPPTRSTGSSPCASAKRQCSRITYFTFVFAMVGLALAVIMPIAQVAHMNAYDTLNISKAELLQQKPEQRLSFLRRQYRRMAVQYHPDTGGDTAKFIQLRDAYNVLKGSIDSSGHLDDAGEIREHLHRGEKEKLSALCEVAPLYGAAGAAAGLVLWVISRYVA